MLDFNLLHTELNIDAARWTTEFHEAIRRVIEKHIGDQWRVTRIKEESSTRYETALATDLTSYPDNILAEAQATFEIEMEQFPFPTHMTLTVKLGSSGKLMITQVRR